jgi:cobalt-zinc-cadmium efflux system membrane fusion protein
VLIDAHEADVRELRPGAKVRLQVPVLGDQAFEARVTAVTDQIDPSTRTIKVRAVVDNPKRLLKSEMLARAHFQRRVDASVEVPASAVFLRGTQHYVFVQTAAGVFAPRDVQLTHEGAQKVLVGEGLRAGDQVVAQNGLLLARELRLAQEAAHVSTSSAGQDKP